MDLVRAFLEIVVPVGVIGLLVYLFERLWPTSPEKIKLLVRVVALIFVVFFLLDRFGLYSFPLRSGG